MKYFTIPAYFFYSLIIAILLISAIFYFAMRDEDKCANNPLVYGARKASDDINGGVMCSCSFSNPDYAPFYFDKNSIDVGWGLTG
jgi:hypothetical protein